MSLQHASTPLFASAEPPAPAPRPPRAHCTVEYVRAGDSGRDSLQAFIAATFFKSYGAAVSHFCDTLIGCRGADGAWIAGLGFSLAAEGPTFLEHYLDVPLEDAIGLRTSQQIERRHIVEVGNLAAEHAGAARAMIVSVTRLLHTQGLHWVAFTATPSLLNSFTRLRLKPDLLAEASPARLPGGGSNWGSYYDTQPQVMFGDIRYGYAELAT